jgi:hypothetical protein
MPLLSPYARHAPPILFFSLLSPAQYIQCKKHVVIILVSSDCSSVWLSHQFCLADTIVIELVTVVHHSANDMYCIIDTVNSESVRRSAVDDKHHQNTLLSPFYR